MRQAGIVTRQLSERFELGLAEGESKRESAGWYSPQERMNSRCRETIPACLTALGLLTRYQLE